MHTKRHEDRKSSKSTFFLVTLQFCLKTAFCHNATKRSTRKPQNDGTQTTAASQPTLITIKSHLEICVVSPKFIILNKYSDL